MPIPCTPTFEHLLNSLTLTRPHTENFGSIALLDPSPRLAGVPTHLGQTVSAFRMPAVTLWFATDTEIDIAALVRRVEGELRSVGHASSTEMARLVLGLFAAIPSTNAPAVERFNRLLGQPMT